MKKKVFRERYYETDTPNAKKIKIPALVFDKETGKVKAKKKSNKGDK